MAPLLPPETTTFTLDNMGRYLCNTLQEAVDSTGPTVAGKRPDFDVIVVGGGSKLASPAGPDPYPRPTSGIFVAMTVMVATFASSGRLAM